MTSQPLTLKAFRAAYPSFTESLYPDQAVQIRLLMADKFFSPGRWSAPAIRDHAMGLYAAHFLELQGSHANGGSGHGGSASGLIASKSVDGASVSFDTATGSFADAGFWNLSPYGKELWYLMQVFGAGAIQL